MTDQDWTDDHDKVCHAIANYDYPFPDDIRNYSLANAVMPVIRALQESAWSEGYVRGRRDEIEDVFESADNPYIQPERDGMERLLSHIQDAASVEQLADALGLIIDPPVASDIAVVEAASDRVEGLCCGQGCTHCGNTTPEGD